MSSKDIVMLQIFQGLLCFPNVNIYINALIDVLGRPVFIHELAKPETL